MAVALKELDAWKETGTLDFRIPDQPPMFPANPEETGIDRIADLLAAQHLQDRKTSYLDDPILLRQREEGWRNIADLDPSRRTRLVGLMRGFELAKLGERDIEIAQRIYPWAKDPLDSDEVFFAIVNDDSRDILIDMLRGLTHHTKYDGRRVLDEQNGLYQQLAESVYGAEIAHSVKYDKDKVYPASSLALLSSISPRQIMRFALEGKLKPAFNFTYPVAELI